jgi:signal transduction histidine kinase
MTIRHWSPRTHQVELFPLLPFGQEPPPKLLILDVIKDRYDPDLLWCRTWGAGFVRFNMRTGHYTTHVRSTPLNDLQNIVYAAVQLGPERWLLNYDRTLTLLDRQLTPFGNMDVHNGGLFRADDGTVLIGGKGTVHALRDPSDRMSVLNGALMSSNVHAAFAQDDAGYWSTHFYDDRRVQRCDPSGQVLRTFRFPEQEPPIEPFLLMVAQHGPLRGGAWLGTTQGLWRIANDTAALEQIALPGIGPPASDPINAMAEGSDGSVWMCVGSISVIRYDPTTHGAQRAIPATPANDRFVSISRLDSAHMLAVRRSGTPYVIGADGRDAHPLRCAAELLPRFNGLEGGIGLRDGRILLYTAGHGLLRFRRFPGPEDLVLDGAWYLPDRPVFGDAAEDQRGRIWLTSNRGAYLLDQRTNELAALDAMHGIPGQYTGRIAVSHSGDVLLSGAGLGRFDAVFEPMHDRPGLVIRSLSANGHDRTPEALAGGSLRIPSTDNNLRIAFSCVALYGGDGYTFAYHLLRDGEPVDSADLARQRTLNLLGMTPGAYRLVITATGATSRPVNVALDFIIEPAWWQTGWARVLFVVCAALLVMVATRAVLAVRYRRKLRELEREREVERVRMRIARDIHDGIGSGLTKITMMTRQLPAESGHAQRIAQASTELVSELGEIVWTVDPRNDSYGSFLAFVRSTLGKQFEHLSVELHADLHCDPADRERTIGPELKRNVLLVMKEAVNNALKHSQGTRIDVHLELGREHVELRVRDNGHGFDPNNIRDGANGLSNFRKRAEAVHGVFDLHSGAGGTTITLRAPLPSTNM